MLSITICMCSSRWKSCGYVAIAMAVAMAFTSPLSVPGGCAFCNAFLLQIQSNQPLYHPVMVENPGEKVPVTSRRCTQLPFPEIIFRARFSLVSLTLSCYFFSFDFFYFSVEPFFVKKFRWKEPTRSAYTPKRRWHSPPSNG